MQHTDEHFRNPGNSPKGGSVGVEFSEVAVQRHPTLTEGARMTRCRRRWFESVEVLRAHRLDAYTFANK